MALTISHNLIAFIDLLFILGNVHYIHPNIKVNVDF